MWKEENIKHTSVKGKHLADLDVEGRKYKTYKCQGKSPSRPRCGRKNNINHKRVKGNHVADLDVEGIIILTIHVSREIT